MKYGNLKHIKSFNLRTNDKVICDIYNQHLPIDEGAIQTAARHGHEELLKLLISKNAPVTTLAMDDAIIRGYLNIVKILHMYNYELINSWNITLAWMWNRHDIIDYFKLRGFVR